MRGGEKSLGDETGKKSELKLALLTLVLSPRTFCGVTFTSRWWCQ